MQPYCSKASGNLIEKQGFVSSTHRKKRNLKRMPRRIQKPNARMLVIRSRVEHVFADQKSQMEIVVHTKGIARATMGSEPANIVALLKTQSGTQTPEPPSQHAITLKSEADGIDQRLFDPSTSSNMVERTERSAHFIVDPRYTVDLPSTWWR